MQYDLARRALLAVAVVCFAVAAGACSSVRALDPASPQELRLAKADRMRLLGDYAGALPIYLDELDSSTGADLDRTAIRARLGRADCRLNLGQEAAGRLDAELVLTALRAADVEAPSALAPLLAEAEQLLGDADLSLGRPHQARPHYTRALDLVDTPGEQDLLWYRLYLCARQEHRPDAAEVHRNIRNRSHPEFARLDRRFLNAREDARKTVPPEPVPALPQVAAQADALAGLGVQPRSSWRAAPPRANKDAMTRIHRVTLHHSGTRFDSLEAGVTASRLRSIQRHHQASNGWADIAYHYVVDRAGRIWEGRALRWQGAHAGNQELNRGNIGVCVLGDFGSQRLTQDQAESLLHLLEALRTHYRIPRGGFLTHQEIRERNQAGSTVCPGSELTHLLHRFRNDAATAFTVSP